jgi:hypothetical protein
MLFIFVGIGYGFYTYILPKYGLNGVLKAVKGIQTSVQNQNYSQFISTDTSATISAAQHSGTDSLQAIKQQVSLLQNIEIASSSPQIQHILKQLQSLPNDKIKEMCTQMCSKL